jgi:hypothetical protein
MTAGPFGLAWTDGRRAHDIAARRKRRQALLVTFVAFLGRTLPRWKKVRTTSMQVTAFAFLDYAAWHAGLIWGCIAIGVSLLVLEYLGGDR